MLEKTRRRWRSFWREFLKPIIVMVLVMGAVRTAVADWFYVPTGSMKPTILCGDRILVDKRAYGFALPFSTHQLLEWADPRRGEVVVFFRPDTGERYVKRVVGVPGDKIELRDNRLWVNGRPADYEPLDADIAEQVDDPQWHTFASEHVDASGHAVMFTPGESLQPFYGPVIVPDGSFFMMGDNRDNSRDSRWFGFVPRDRIIGRAVRVALSFDPERVFLPRWRRFFSSLP